MTNRNWAGNIAYAASGLLTPATVPDAQQMVRDAKKVRALGSRHCFNDIADTPGTQILLAKLNRMVSIDKAKRQVTVEGGIKYGELGPPLHAAGFSLHNLASLPHISIAGACATATHGSGPALGGLATAVASLTFITAAGDLVTLSRDKDGDTFNGAAINLGALGLIVEITLDVEPAFDARQDIYRDLPMGEVEANFAAMMAAGYSVSLFTGWQQGPVVEQIWIKRRVTPGENFTAPAAYFGGWLAKEDTHPIAGLDAVHVTTQTGIPGPSYDRLPHFKVNSTPASGEELQSEYFVPAEHGVAALRAVAALRDRMKPILLVSEVRTIAADDLWLSPYYKQPCVAFHFSFKQDWNAVTAFLPHLEQALAPFSPRPHWGKVFTMPAKQVQSLYPRLPDFRDLLATHDPHGKFRNAYIEKYIFG